MTVTPHRGHHRRLFHEVIRVHAAELHDVIKDPLERHLGGFGIAGFKRADLCDGSLCDFGGDGEEDGFSGLRHHGALDQDYSCGNFPLLQLQAELIV